MSPPDAGSTTPIMQVKSNILILSCVRCQKRQSYPLDQLRAAGKEYITCSCGQRYRLGRREKRHFLRKRVKLPGTLLDPNTQQPLGQIIIVDLSVGGVGFDSQEHPVQVGDPLIIAFDLDDRAKTHIEEPIVVRNVRDGRRAGAEFTTSDGYHFELDFYLNP